MRWIIFGMLLAVLLVPAVQAIGGCDGDYSPRCLDSSILICEKTWNLSGTLYPQSYNITCLHGCSSIDNACMAVDITENSFWWAFGIIFIGFGIYLAYIAFVEFTRPGELLEGEEEHE